MINGLKGITFVVLFALLATQTYAKNDKHEREDRYEREDSDAHKQKRDHKRVHREEKKHKQMNRGMQKRLDSGKALPPGWQDKVKKGERLDEEVYAQSRTVEPVNVRGEIVIEVDERLIRLHHATMEIIDILK